MPYCSRSVPRFVSLVALLSVFVFSYGNASAANFVVTNNNSTGPGSLAEAIGAANSNGQSDVITFDPTFFSVPREISAPGEIAIGADGANPGRSITISGPGRELLTISGGMNRIFGIAQSSVVTIENLTLIGGQGGGAQNPGIGGAIFAFLADTVTLNNVRIAGASAEISGGAFGSIGSKRIRINDSLITGNSISGPQANQGGGLYLPNLNGGELELTIKNSEISSNTSSRSFPGAVLGAANVLIENSIFSNNLTASDSIGEGGGVLVILNQNGRGLMKRAQVFGNSARSLGGGITISGADGSVIRIYESSITGNSAFGVSNGSGCGIYRRPGSNVKTEIYGTLVAGNNCVDTEPVTAETNFGAGLFLPCGGACETTIINSTIAFNNTGGISGGGRGAGGGIAVSGGGHTLRILNSTIAKNMAGQVKGGVYAQNGGGGIIAINPGTANPTVFVQNTLIAENFAQPGTDVSGNFASVGHNLVGSYKEAWAGGFEATGDITGVDPMLNPVGLLDNGGPTLTLGITEASIAINHGAPGGEDLDGNPLRFDQRGACFFRNMNVNPDIGAFEFGATQRAGDTEFDFDGDCVADKAIYRPGPSEFWYLRSSLGGHSAYQFGNGSESLVPGDFTGDGVTDFTLYRPAAFEWFVLTSQIFGYYSFPFGASGDVPVAGDFDGDGVSDPTIFRPANGTWWTVRSSDGQVSVVSFGALGDRPLVGDYDGDGIDDFGIYRPAVAQFWQLRSTSGVVAFSFGATGDTAFSRDMSGDGSDDLLLFRPATGQWFVLRSEDLGFYGFQFGANGDLPAPADYDGDGITDVAVFRPSNGIWYSLESTSGVLFTPFGSNGDIPIPGSDGVN
ncbi:MAG: hypothetical protein IPM63_08960 [Acidobacteriota bacterium]|nr:MAG: hypothetical protein IPM63_08960 [Acidobacteriota bacterium]